MTQVLLDRSTLNKQLNLSVITQASALNILVIYTSNGTSDENIDHHLWLFSVQLYDNSTELFIHNHWVYSLKDTASFSTK